MAFEKYILPQDDDPKMSLHLFVAILSEYLQGKKDGATAKEAIEDHLGTPLTAKETQDILDTLTYVDNGADAFEKRNRLDEVYRVMILAEGNTWYNTQSLLRTRLNWSTP